ncbi:MAG: CoA transferase [Chloroflexi bacterium]|nr:CoA transferase [Chloroflexota bacterium]
MDSRSGPRPLDGVRVLDFTHVLAGPFGTRVLGDLGADVVKVSTAGRSHGVGSDSARPYFAMWNRNKRALALDMATDEARRIALDLATRADVLIDNFSPGVLDRWGLTEPVLRAANPGLIVVNMSGMGAGGPWSSYVTYAPTIHALSGLTALTGVPGRDDIGIGFSYNDHAAGLHATLAVLAALEARRRDGHGQRIEVAQFETGVNFLGPTLLDLVVNGGRAEATGNHLPYDAAAPHGCYPCWPLAGAVPGEEERWVAIAVMNDGQWQALRALLGDPVWARDPALDTAAGRVEARDTIDREMAAWTRTQDAEAVMERCQAAGVPAGVVQSGVDLTQRDPQLRASGFFTTADEEHSTIGVQHVDRLPLRFSATPIETYAPSRLTGADTAAVLADWLGMSAEEVAAGEAAGTLR